MAIQKATQAALAGGFRVRDVFKAVEEIRARVDAPVLVMTYWNPVLQYGVDRFADTLRDAGGAGLITPDITPDSAADWIATSERTGLDRVFLAAPELDRRAPRRDRRASRGFVYAVSTMGITGRPRRRGCRRPRARRPDPRSRGRIHPHLRRNRHLDRRPGRRGARVRRRRDRRLRARPRPRRRRRRRRRTHGVRTGQGKVDCAATLRSPSPAAASPSPPTDVVAVHASRSASWLHGLIPVGPGRLRRSRSTSTRCASSPASSPRSSSRTSASPSAAASRGSSSTSPCGASSVGIIGARIYHVLTHPDDYFGPGKDAEQDPLHLGGRRRDLRRAPRRRHRLRDRLPDRRPPLLERRRRARPRPAARPGARPLRQLVQPGAVRAAHRPAVGPRDRPPQPGDPGRPRRRRAVPPDVPLRDDLEPRRGVIIVFLIENTVRITKTTPWPRACPRSPSRWLGVEPDNSFIGRFLPFRVRLTRRPQWQWGKVLGLYLIWYGLGRTLVRVDPPRSERDLPRHPHQRLGRAGRDPARDHHHRRADATSPRSRAEPLRARVASGRTRLR